MPPIPLPNPSDRLAIFNALMQQLGVGTQAQNAYQNVAAAHLLRGAFPYTPVYQQLQMNYPPSAYTSLQDILQRPALNAPSELLPATRFFRNPGDYFPVKVLHPASGEPLLPSGVVQIHPQDPVWQSMLNQALGRPQVGPLGAKPRPSLDPSVEWRQFQNVEQANTVMEAENLLSPGYVRPPLPTAPSGPLPAMRFGRSVPSMAEAEAPTLTRALGAGVEAGAMPWTRSAPLAIGPMVAMGGPQLVNALPLSRNVKDLAGNIVAGAGWGATGFALGPEVGVPLTLAGGAIGGLKDLLGY